MMMKSKKTDQPPRSHKGAIYPQPRDVAGITFAYEQRAVSLDHWQVYLGRYSKRQTAEAGRLTRSAASQVIERWEKLGWVVTARPFATAEWVWPSRAGMQALLLHGTSRAPVVGDFPRYHALTHLRLTLEERYPGARWESERYLRQDADRRYADDDRMHIPDAVQWRKEGEQEKSHAIRVDVDLCAHQEIVDFLEQMLDTYDVTEYYATSRTFHNVQGGRDLLSLDEEDEGRIKILKVEESGDYKLIG